MDKLIEKPCEDCGTKLYLKPQYSYVRRCVSCHSHKEGTTSKVVVNAAVQPSDLPIGLQSIFKSLCEVRKKGTTKENLVEETLWIYNKLKGGD